jgi:hypothetical protein
VTVSVTITVCGVFVAPEAAIVKGAVYVPADMPDVLIASPTDPAPVPLKTLGVSQAALSETDQLRVPVPVLLIDRV